MSFMANSLEPTLLNHKMKDAYTHIHIPRKFDVYISPQASGTQGSFVLW